MQIKVYKSKYKGEFFEKKEDYEKHIEKQIKLEKEQKIQKELKLKAEQLKNEPRLTCTSIKDFEEKAFKNINILNQGNPDELLLLEFSNLRFGDLSNSHSSPIEGKTNFFRKDDLPTFYKGWNGIITIVFSKEENTGKNRDKIENILKNFPGINTGSGGYRGKEYKSVKGYVLQYDLRLYLSDFPELKKLHMKYESLLDKKDKWDKKIENLCNIKNEQDEEIISNSLKLKDIDNKLVLLRQEEKNLLDIISLKRSSNINSILEKNSFKQEKELMDLNETFKNSYW